MNPIKTAWLNFTTCRAPSDHWDSYDHWYCMKRRWHGRQTPARGLVSFAHVHRYNNYIWRDGEKPDYEPIPFDISASLRTGLTPRKRSTAPAGPYTEQETTNP
jgi:hypothetical protein